MARAELMLDIAAYNQALRQACQALQAPGQTQPLPPGCLAKAQPSGWYPGLGRSPLDGRPMAAAPLASPSQNLNLRGSPPIPLHHRLPDFLHLLHHIPLTVFVPLFLISATLPSCVPLCASPLHFLKHKKETHGCNAVILSFILLGCILLPFHRFLCFHHCFLLCFPRYFSSSSVSKSLSLSFL